MISFIHPCPFDVLAGDPRVFGPRLNHEFPPPRAPCLEIDESADGLTPVVLRNEAVGSLVGEEEEEGEWEEDGERRGGE